MSLEDVTNTAKALGMPDDFDSVIGTGGSFDAENMALMFQPIAPWRPFDQTDASVVSSLDLSDKNVDIADEILGEAAQGRTTGQADEAFGQGLRYWHVDMNWEPTMRRSEPTGAANWRQVLVERSKIVLGYLDKRHMCDLDTPVPDCVIGQYLAGDNDATDPRSFVGSKFGLHTRLLQFESVLE